MRRKQDVHYENYLSSIAIALVVPFPFDGPSLGFNERNPNCVCYRTPSPGNPVCIQVAKDLSDERQILFLSVISIFLTTEDATATATELQSSEKKDFQ